MVSQVLGLVSEVVGLGSEVLGLGFKVLAPLELDLGVLEPPRLEGSFLEASQARFGFNFSVLEPPGLGCGVLEPLRAVPRCVEVRFGENQWWVPNDPPQRQRLNDKVWRRGSRNHAPKPRVEASWHGAVLSP